MNFTIYINIIFSIIYCLIEPIRNSTNTALFLFVFTLHLIFCFFILGKKYNISKYNLILFFILCRIAIIPMQPWLSDDVYTYLWQGKLLANGENVYLDKPESTTWINYRDEVYEKMGNKNVAAIYPPLTIIIYGANHKLASYLSNDWKFEYYLWKIFLFISELIAFIILIKIFENQNLFYPLAYAVLPLSMIEIAGQGHNDGLLFIFIALLISLISYSGIKSKIYLCIQIAILTLIKIIPIFFLAVFLKMKIKLIDKIIILFLTIIFIILISYPFFYENRSLETFLNSQNYYNMIASFNSFFLIISRYILKIFNFREWWIVAPYLVQILRLIALIIAFIIIKPVDKNSIINGFIIFYLIPILISSKVHPWYFAPVIYLAIYNKKIALAFALQIFIYSYHYYLEFTKSQLDYFDILVWILSFLFFYFFIKFKNS